MSVNNLEEELENCISVGRKNLEVLRSFLFFLLALYFDLEKGTKQPNGISYLVTRSTKSFWILDLSRDEARVKISFFFERV